MSRAWPAVLATAMLLLAAGASAGDGANDAGESFFNGLEALPADQRFRQLSLMLMVTDGADQALIQALSARLAEMDAGAARAGAPDFDFDDYTTPLIRIVDQETMLAGATRLFRFTREHAGRIGAELDEALAETMEENGPPPTPVIAEDAIIIRNAIADSIDYATLDSAGGGEPLSSDYRARTIYLRNNLEFELFAAELDRITADAIASVGGKTDAYQRMFDDEVDAAQLDKKIKAAEYAYGWDRDFDRRAARLAEEILNRIWDRESNIDP